MEKIIEMYMATQKSKSENTKKSYLNALLKFSRKTGPTECPTNKDFYNYVDFIKKKSKSDASFNLTISVLKNFAKFLLVTTDNDYDLDLFEREKIRVEPPQMYIKSELVYKLMDGINVWSRSGPMQASLVGILYECGVKRSTLLDLRLENVHERENKLFINIKDGGISKEYELSVSTTLYLKTYLEVMRKQRRHRSQSDYLFQRMSLNHDSPDNKPLNPKTVNEILAKGCEYANIPIKITPAHIRNSFLDYMKESELYTIRDKSILSGFKTDIAFYTTCRRLEELRI